MNAHSLVRQRRPLQALRFAFFCLAALLLGFSSRGMAEETSGQSKVAATPKESVSSSAPEKKKSSSITNGVDKDARRHTWPSEGAIGDSFREVAKELRCPTCTGLSVLESDAAFSVQIKDIVKEQVEAGKSKDEILQYFTARFGPWILRSPPVAGFNLLAWGLPLGLLVMGPPLIWFFIWRRRRVVSTVGVRPDGDILREMHDRLDQLRVLPSDAKGR